MASPEQEETVDLLEEREMPGPLVPLDLLDSLDLLLVLFILNTHVSTHQHRITELSSSAYLGSLWTCWTQWCSW